MGIKLLKLDLTIKKSLIRIGDNIEFTNTKNIEKISVDVINLLKSQTFEDLFDKYNIFDFGENNKKGLLDNTRQYYSKERKKFGVLGIKIKYLL